MTHLILSISGLAGSGKDTLAAHLARSYGFSVDHLAYDLKDIARRRFGWDGEKDARGRELLQKLGTEVGRSRHQFIWLYKFARRNRLELPVYPVLEFDPLIELMPRERAELVLGMETTLTGHLKMNAAKIAVEEFFWDGRFNKRGADLVNGIYTLATGYDPAGYFLGQVGDSWKVTAGARATEGIYRGSLAVPDVRFPNEAEVLKYNGAVSIKVVRPGVVTMSHASETALDGYHFDHIIENDGTEADLFIKADQLIKTLTNRRAA